VDGRDFDGLTKRLSGVFVSRRLGLRAAAFGMTAALASAGLGPRYRGGLAASTPEATPAGSGAEGTFLCDQRYALCSSAPCEPPLAGATTVKCRCVVLDGYSIGFTACDERAPKGRALVSTFSTQNMTSESRFMVCPAGNTWANCLDAPCMVDPTDATRATCECPIVTSGEFLTVGGACDVTTCSSVVWSAATLTLPVSEIYAAEMKKLGHATTFPAACPGSPEMATPAASL
jgi:hypothetical protein